MSYQGELTPEEREAIVASVNARLRPNEDRDAHSLWADVLKDAFASIGRPLVYLDAGSNSGFLAYNGRGSFSGLKELELQSLLFDCGDRSKLRQATVNTIIRTLKARAGVSEAYFSPGQRCLVCVDVTLVLDWDPPDGIRCEEHSPEHRARGSVPIAFMSAAGRAELQTFFDETFRDPVAVQRLTEQVGLALFGEGCLFQRVFLVHGEGLNGKGTLAKLIKAIFPKGQVTSLPPKDIPPEWGRAQLHGSRLNLVSELDRLGEEDITALKGLVTGEPMSARNSKERGFTLEPEALHLICTNNLPQLGARTRALSRRFVVLRAVNEIAEDQQDPNYERRLLQIALPALLNQCVENARMAVQRLQSGDGRFEISPDMRSSTDALFGADHVDHFIRSHLRQSEDFEGDRIRTEEVRAAYKAFCATTRNAPISPANLSRRLKEAGFPTQKVDGGVMHLVGVQWNSVEGGQGAVNSNTR